MAWNVRVMMVVSIARIGSSGVYMLMRMCG